MLKSFYPLILLFVVSNVFAGDYFRTEIGVVHWSPVGDNLWYQDTHNHSIYLNSLTLVGGVGHSFGKTSIEANARYLHGGRFWSEWEHDNTYGVPNADHSVTGRGSSRWKVYGVSIDGTYTPIRYLTLRGGVFFFNGVWTTKHVENDRPNEVQIFSSKWNGIAPILGFEINLTPNISFVTSRYLGLSHPDVGIENATTFTISMKF